LGRRGLKIHCVNCHNFSSAAAAGRAKNAPMGGGGGMMEGGQGGGRNKFEAWVTWTDKTWDQISQLGLAKSGLKILGTNCHS
jgi:Spy/CpxP family protein refolding chaperone